MKQFDVHIGDITTLEVDVIVNAASRSLRGGGGVDGSIRWAAGPELDEECLKLGGCEVGQSKVTRGYDLPSKWVIHTVGPKWNGGFNGERKLLQSCYQTAMALADSLAAESIVFPLISTGAYGYPANEGFDVAELLIEHGAEINARSDTDWMPLHWAALKNSLDVARLLLDIGAEVDAKTNNGNTPLFFAAGNKSFEMTHLLRVQGANTNGIDLSWMN